MTPVAMMGILVVVLLMVGLVIWWTPYVLLWGRDVYRNFYTLIIAEAIDNWHAAWRELRGQDGSDDDPPPPGSTIG